MLKNCKFVKVSILYHLKQQNIGWAESVFSFYFITVANELELCVKFCRVGHERNSIFCVKCCLYVNGYKHGDIVYISSMKVWYPLSALLA
jgi:hypothetical protein